jgi:peroxiredoxin
MTFPNNRAFKIVLLALLSTSLALASACSSSASAQGQMQGLIIDQPAPDFQIKDTKGNLVSLSNFRGRPVFFNYWASWCPSCVKEMPILQGAYEDFSRTDLVYLTINAGEDLKTVSGFAQKNGLTFPVLLDSQNEAGARYNIFSIPVSVFIDRNGVLKSRVVGAFNDKQSLERMLQSIVN